MSKAEDYNGWKNRQTWNVALWINNDEALYKKARQFAQRFGTDPHPYAHMIRCYAMKGERTGDGVRFDDPRVSRTEMDAMLRELAE